MWIGSYCLCQYIIWSISRQSANYFTFLFQPNQQFYRFTFSDEYFNFYTFTKRVRSADRIRFQGYTDDLHGLYFRFGYYVHGRSVHGRSDTDMLDLQQCLKREENAQTGARGLEPGEDLQVRPFLIQRVEFSARQIIGTIK